MCSMYSRSGSISQRYGEGISFSVTPPPEIYTLSLHDALPNSALIVNQLAAQRIGESHQRMLGGAVCRLQRSEEHTSELQSRVDLVCRLLLEKKNDPEAVDRVARLTHRRLEPGGAVWRVQAERL